MDRGYMVAAAAVANRRSPPGLQTPLRCPCPSLASGARLPRSWLLSTSAFEILHGALMLLGFFSRLECAEIAALACSRIYFPRVETVLVRLDFANHAQSLRR